MTSRPSSTGLDCAGDVSGPSRVTALLRSVSFAGALRPARLRSVGTPLGLDVLRSCVRSFDLVSCVVASASSGSVMASVVSCLAFVGPVRLRVVISGSSSLAVASCF